VGQRVLKIFRCTMRSWLPVRNAINPRVTNGVITVAAGMRSPRWFEPTYVWLWPFSSSGISGVAFLEWLTTGQLRVWSFFGNLDHYVIFSQEPVFFVFGFVTMSVMMVATLIAIVVLNVED
jgi:hypothetical protein